jgi:hypothetical protein
MSSFMHTIPYYLIGHSVSWCIVAMLEDEVNPDQVAEIICGTKCHTEEDLELLYKGYRERFWAQYNEADVLRLWERFVLEPFRHGHLIQPRLDGGYAPNPSKSLWSLSRVKVSARLWEPLADHEVTRENTTMACETVSRLETEVYYGFNLRLVLSKYPRLMEGINELIDQCLVARDPNRNKKKEG